MTAAAAGSASGEDLVRGVLARDAEPAGFAAAVDALRRAPELGVTPWRAVTAQDVAGFARITGDAQWIHTEPDRARAEGPFGGPIVHGMLVLALSTTFAAELLHSVGAVLMVHRGLSEVRFTGAVPVGARVRGAVRVVEVCERRGCADVSAQVTVEVLDETGSPRTAAVATQTLRCYASLRHARLSASLARR